MKSVYVSFVLPCAVIYEKHRLSIENELKGDRDDIPVCKGTAVRLFVGNAKCHNI